MSGIFLRWGVPALATVVGGTALAVSATSGAMTADLSARAEQVLAADDGLSWATVSFDARDAVLTGTAPTQELVDQAVERVAALHGVRSVRAEVVFAEFASPFPFAATVEDGTIRLSGGVPDEATRTELVAAAGAATDELRLLAGAPRRDAWKAAIDYGLQYLKHFDEGEISLADLELTITGRAASSSAFDELALLETAPLPDGVSLAKREIAPPLVSPYEWRASFDGATVAVSGYAPTAEFAEALRVNGIGGRPVSTSLVLASGAPATFEETARVALENLVLLEEGTVEISDSTLVLRGAPADEATAERVRLAMTPLGAELDLAPPRIDAYDFVATRSGGVTVLEGHVPDAATRDRLDAIDGVDAAALELARGAPERFESGIEFGLDLLSHLSEGQFTVSGTSLAIEGRAATLADFTALETALALGAPQGLILASADIKPPLASPFVWSAEKSEEGGVRIAGYVPSRAVRDSIHAAIADLEADETTLADGNPANFETEAVAALKILPLLTTARIEYDGTHWSLNGTAASPDEAFAANQAFEAAGLDDAGWAIDIDLPAPPEVAALPSVDPYFWRARKDGTGAIAFEGYVPTEELKRFIAVRAGDIARDATELALGEPPGFIADVLAGLEALSHLDSGTVTLEGGLWTLTGVPLTAGDAEQALAALGTATSGGAAWQKQLAAPAIPEETPEPAAEPEPDVAEPTPEETAEPAEPAVAETPAQAPQVRNFTFSASKPLGGAIVLEGAVPADAARRFFGVIAGNVPTDDLRIASSLPEDFIPNADAGIRALASLESGEFGLEGEAWVLTGRAESEADKAAVMEALAAVPGTAGWQTDITLLPAIDVCRQKVAAFASRNAILFQSGSARLADESIPALDELAGYLAACPEATVHVEGHTDADGDDELNLALSVARAEAVVEALIERGVGYQRLYAVGYGESLPIADNDTGAGKRANRRIAFTILGPNEQGI